MSVAVLGHAGVDEGALGAADVAVALRAAGSTPGDFGVCLASDDVRDGALALALAHRTRTEARVGLGLSRGAGADGRGDHRASGSCRRRTRPSPPCWAGRWPWRTRRGAPPDPSFAGCSRPWEFFRACIMGRASLPEETIR